jgi:GDP-L-fucose synthase
MIKELIGFEGRIVLDATKPDGTPRKILDVSKLHSLGWRHKISLEDGLRKVYEDYITTTQEKTVA